MLEKIKNFFHQHVEESEQHSEQKTALACTSLLIEIALSDDHFDESEVQQIATVAKAHFNLSQAEVDELLNLAQEEVAQATDLHQFTRLINETFDGSQKQLLIESLWAVAYSDGIIDKYEEYLLRKISDLLYITHSQFIRAKHTARDRNNKN